MDLEDDLALQDALERLGDSGASFLGSGGEARVYALDDQRVLRITHAGADRTQIGRAIDFVAGLTAPADIALPEVLDLWEAGDRVLTVERRLPGRSLLDDLGRVDDGPGRARLVESHLDAAAAIATMADVTPAGAFGEFLVAKPIVSSTLHGFLAARARGSIEQVSSGFPAVDIDELVAALPDLVDPALGCLVHLDAFAGNMMSNGSAVTAVIDFGGAVVVGAPWMNGVAAAVYLTVPTITPTARPADVGVARSWLRNQALSDLEDPFRRWLAAYWAFAEDDRTLHAWCRQAI